MAASASSAFPSTWELRGARVFMSQKAVRGSRFPPLVKCRRFCQHGAKGSRRRHATHSPCPRSLDSRACSTRPPCTRQQTGPQGPEVPSLTWSVPSNLQSDRLLSSPWPKPGVRGHPAQRSGGEVRGRWELRALPSCLLSPASPAPQAGLYLVEVPGMGRPVSTSTHQQ